MASTARAAGIMDWLLGQRVRRTGELGLRGTERDRALVELNVLEQVHSLSQSAEAAEALQKHQLNVWGMVYDKASKKGYQLVEA
ncbi:putative carbonate dehydratase [Aspergillus fischeri NRRL 181]|uniref:Carbonic anhydrase n=1 Tax=Neosartorya fischeri (strain ATCC 1020 / DSM 3700 / CBS 544.65 / FGSC A1164 / JCM 1740 / NRRL 181 / WB 181) TaxID=331117 RepID=A1DBP5_NEOFI|nr:uncharacterized protein NFIA_099190 [Aspergillus fischeri NRRL 181]EAW20285.1 hypothetical protein NFIA_099190 [Aspergillus fischeri NRRL 181]